MEVYDKKYEKNAINIRKVHCGVFKTPSPHVQKYRFNLIVLLFITRAFVFTNFLILNLLAILLLQLWIISETQHTSTHVVYNGRLYLYRKGTRKQINVSQKPAVQIYK